MQKFIRTHYQSIAEAARAVCLPSFIIDQTDDSLLVEHANKEELEAFVSTPSGEVLSRTTGLDEYPEIEGMSEDAFMLWWETRPDVFGLIERLSLIKNSHLPFFGCANTFTLQRMLGFLLKTVATYYPLRISPLNRLRAYVYFFHISLELEKIEGALQNQRGLKKTPPGLAKTVEYVLHVTRSGGVENPNFMLTVGHKVTIKHLTYIVRACMNNGLPLTRVAVVNELQRTLHRRGESFYAETPWYHMSLNQQLMFERAYEKACELFPALCCKDQRAEDLLPAPYYSIVS